MADSPVEPPLPIALVVISKYHMKFCAIISLIILTTGCQNLSSTKLKVYQLIDRDSLMLGTVTCLLPLDFDTTYKWVCKSDTWCGGDMKYRSHSTKFDIVREVEAFPGEYLDSGFYFTISHAINFACDTQNQTTDENKADRDEHRKNNIRQLLIYLKDKSPSEVKVDTSHNINKNNYDIFYYTDNGYYKIKDRDSFKIKTVSFSMLTASTEYKNHYIGFTIQSNVHNRDSFYLIAMNILNSVKIK
ncbi:MAG: hypothetical protein WBP41_11865 [Saprospiraceae bacterium]